MIFLLNVFKFAFLSWSFFLSFVPSFVFVLLVPFCALQLANSSFKTVAKLTQPTQFRI